MAMEKYGIDMEATPPTKEQLERIKAMDPSAKLPLTFKEAVEKISEMEK